MNTPTSVPGSARPHGSRFQRTTRHLWREWIKPGLVILLVMSAFRSAVADWNDVPTGSMEPTILVGDRVVVNKLAYDLKVPFTTWHIAEWGDPQRGDIVVCFSPADGTRLVKRVVGVPADLIALRDNRLIVNGRALDYAPLPATRVRAMPERLRSGHAFAEEELTGRRHTVMAMPTRPALRSFEPVTVPAGQYFLMGDNRDNSFDSRYFGFVPRGQIVGRAEGVAFSLDRDRWWLPRWGRFCEGLD